MPRDDREGLEKPTSRISVKCGRVAGSHKKYISIPNIKSLRSVTGNKILFAV